MSKNDSLVVDLRGLFHLLIRRVRVRLLVAFDLVKRDSLKDCLVPWPYLHHLDVDKPPCRFVLFSQTGKGNLPTGRLFQLPLTFY